MAEGRFTFPGIRVPERFRRATRDEYQQEAVRTQRMTPQEVMEITQNIIRATDIDSSQMEVSYSDGYDTGGGYSPQLDLIDRRTRMTIRTDLDSLFLHDREQVMTAMTNRVRRFVRDIEDYDRQQLRRTGVCRISNADIDIILTPEMNLVISSERIRGLSRTVDGPFSRDVIEQYVPSMLEQFLSTMPRLDETSLELLSSELAILRDPQMTETRDPFDEVYGEGYQQATAAAREAIAQETEAMRADAVDARNNMTAQQAIQIDRDRLVANPFTMDTGGPGMAIANPGIYDYPTRVTDGVLSPTPLDRLIRDRDRGRLGQTEEPMEDETGRRMKFSDRKLCREFKLPFSGNKEQDRALRAVRGMAFLEQHALMCLAKGQEPNLSEAMDVFNEIAELMEAQLMDDSTGTETEPPDVPF